jgi:hypothetical protein
VTQRPRAGGGARAGSCHHRQMLLATHLVTGAAVGLAVEGALPRTAVALATHAVLDSIDHEDTLGLLAQGTLAAAALGALAVGSGWHARVLGGALVSAVPDVEIAVGMLSGHGKGPFLFPSHWQLPGRRGAHPWRLTPRRLPLGVEVVATAALCGLVCVWSRRSAAGS